MKIAIFHKKYSKHRKIEFNIAELVTLRNAKSYNFNRTSMSWKTCN